MGLTAHLGMAYNLGMASWHRRVGRWLQQIAWPRSQSSLARHIASMIGIPLALTVVVLVWFSLNPPADRQLGGCGLAPNSEPASVACFAPPSAVDMNPNTRQAQRQSQGGTGAFAGGYNGTLEYCRDDCLSARTP
jgi:hypothetical protein